MRRTIILVLSPQEDIAIGQKISMSINDTRKTLTLIESTEGQEEYTDEEGHRYNIFYEQSTLETTILKAHEEEPVPPMNFGFPDETIKIDVKDQDGEEAHELEVDFTTLWMNLEEKPPYPTYPFPHSDEHPENILLDPTNIPGHEDNDTPNISLPIDEEGNESSDIPVILEGPSQNDFSGPPSEMTYTILGDNTQESLFPIGTIFMPGRALLVYRAYFDYLK